MSTTDIDAIMAADHAFATAWLENDQSKVMATLTPDAVIIPSGGPAIEGAAAIQETWWPADSVPTLVTEFEVVQRESGGSGDVGFVRGSYSLAWKLVTDQLKSYSVAHRNVMPSVAHRMRRYANNRAEVSQQPTRQRERQMRGFKSAGQAQRFLSVHGVVQNLFRLGRHQLRSENYRLLRARSFEDWSAATAL